MTVVYQHAVCFAARGCFLLTQDWIIMDQPSGRARTGRCPRCRGAAGCRPPSACGAETPPPSSSSAGSAPSWTPCRSTCPNNTDTMNKDGDRATSTCCCPDQQQICCSVTAVMSTAEATTSACRCMHAPAADAVVADAADPRAHVGDDRRPITVHASGRQLLHAIGALQQELNMS